MPMTRKLKLTVLVLTIASLLAIVAFTLAVGPSDGPALSPKARCPTPQRGSPPPPQPTTA